MQITLRHDPQGSSQLVRHDRSKLIQHPASMPFCVPYMTLQIQQS